VTPLIVEVFAADLLAMDLITILNRCYHFRGFVYQHADHKSIEILVRPRQGLAAVCARGHQPAGGKAVVAASAPTFSAAGCKMFNEKPEAGFLAGTSRVSVMTRSGHHQAFLSGHGSSFDSRHLAGGPTSTQQ
jgi:hypothetical protein